MPDFRQAKTMAKLLRQGLGKRQIIITHSDSLEMVAQQFGYANWNVLAARIDQNDNTAELKVPKNWKITGKSHHLYQCGIDPVRKDGTALIHHKSDDDCPTADEFATLMQSIAADNFRSKRMCLTAELKTSAVTDTGTIWLRIDGAHGAVLKFDNMERRSSNGALTGTMDWIERQIVLDVPETAQSIHYGFFLRGAGSTWCRKLKLDEAATGAPETAGHKELLPQPQNMDFMEISG